MGIVRLDEVTFRYDDRGPHALTALNYSVEPGVIGLIGVNGAGKSTLLNVLAGVLAPTSGRCLVSDADGVVRPATANRARRDVALMPQDVVLPTSLRLMDFMMYMGWVRGIPRRERRRACLAALERVGLRDRSAGRIGDLSGGMRRRLLLAQALLGRPRLLLLDEPAASLDPEQRAGFRELVASLDTTATSILISSHDIDDLATVCDQLVMLECGSVVFQGTPEELRRQGAALVAGDSSLSPFEAAFVQLRRTAPSGPLAAGEL